MFQTGPLKVRDQVQGIAHASSLLCHKDRIKTPSRQPKLSVSLWHKRTGVSNTMIQTNQSEQSRDGPGPMRVDHSDQNVHDLMSVNMRLA